MLYFFGNCQADFVSRAMQRRGHKADYRVFASPLTYPSHPGAVPESLLARNTEFDLGPYFHGRELTHQFVPIGQGDPKPKLIFLSLFHENVPLFVHGKENYVFFMDPRALSDHPGIMDWTQANCRMFKPNPAKYLDRYREMLAKIREAHPDVPIVVLSRLSHFPAFGPDPFSYLEGWGGLWRKADDVLASWADTMDHVHILDMNRVFGGIWNNSNKRIESHCPFLKIRLEEQDGQVTALHAQRDIEHVGPMPDRLADKLEGFLKTGMFQYDDNEHVPVEWRRQWRPSGMDRDTMLAKLSSGANYDGAEAVAAFFLDMEHDYTDLLLRAADRMAVCHMTLHMIKAYGRIHRNPALAEWCNTHLSAARSFTANGPLYREAYIKRVESIKRHALGKSASA